jgi:hypothetical protein
VIVKLSVFVLKIGNNGLIRIIVIRGYSTVFELQDHCSELNGTSYDNSEKADVQIYLPALDCE